MSEQTITESTAPAVEATKEEPITPTSEASSAPELPEGQATASVHGDILGI